MRAAWEVAAGLVWDFEKEGLLPLHCKHIAPAPRPLFSSLTSVSLPRHYSSAPGSSWVHYALELNALGRTRPNPPRVDDEGNEVADEGAPEPSMPLKPASEDAPVDEAAEEGGGSWDVRGAPATGVPEGETAPVAIVRSLRWPGAVTVGFAKKRWVNAYVGDGLEATLAHYQPALPAAAPSEYDFVGEATKVAELADVAKDPDEGKPKEGEGEGDE